MKEKTSPSLHKTNMLLDNLCEHLSSSPVFSGVCTCVAHLFSFLCCPSMFGSSLPPVVCRRVQVCLIYVICVCLHTVVSNTYCVVFLFCFSSSCVPYDANFSGFSFFDRSFGIF